MTNELLGVAFALLTFTLVLTMYRMFGMSGLFVWIGFSTVVANIQVVKTIEVFGITATMGNVLYGSAFLVTDILHERHGKKAAQKAVWMGFFTLLAMTLITQITLVFTPAESDFAQESLQTLFGLLPRIAAGSMLAYLISQNLDVHLYTFFKKCFPGEHRLWIRNNGSTMISQFVDTLIFTSIAFIGVYEWSIWVDIFISTYLLKWLVAAADTPFVYIARRMKLPEARNEGQLS